MDPKQIVNGKARVEIIRVIIIVALAVGGAWLTTVKTTARTLGNVQTEIAVASERHKEICRRIDGLEAASNAQTVAINALVTAVRVLESTRESPPR